MLWASELFVEVTLYPSRGSLSSMMMDSSLRQELNQKQALPHPAAVLWRNICADVRIAISHEEEAWIERNTNVPFDKLWRLAVLKIELDSHHNSLNDGHKGVDKMDPLYSVVCC